MKKSSPRSHRATIIVLLIATVFCAAGFGLGAVWLRQQISYSAGSYAQLEAELRDLDRRNSLLGTRIAQAHSPQALLARLTPGMRPTVEAQVVRARLNGLDYAPEQERLLRPFESSIDIALIHSTRRLPANE